MSLIAKVDDELRSDEATTADDYDLHGCPLMLQRAISTPRSGEASLRDGVWNAPKGGEPSSRRCSMALEPTTQAFINGLSGPPLPQLGPAAAHKVLTDLQSQPIALQPAQIEDAVWPIGPTGQTRIRIVRPA